MILTQYVQQCRQMYELQFFHPSISLSTSLFSNKNDGPSLVIVGTGFIVKICNPENLHTTVQDKKVKSHICGSFQWPEWG